MAGARAARFSMHYTRAIQAFEAGRFEAARSEAALAFEANPENAAAADLLGIATLRLEGASDSAVAVYRRALEVHQENASILNNYGRLLWERGDLEGARDSFLRAVGLRPRWGKVWSNLATVNEALGFFGDAIEALRHSLSVKPRSSRSWHKLARLLELEKRFDEALAVYDQAVRMKPDDAKARYNKSLLLLKLGHYAAGWREFEWRFAIEPFPLPTTVNWNPREWDGTAFQGKTLLVEQEQGFGDAIQMARYVPMVKRLGGTVKVRCRPRLRRLFLSIPEIDGILNQNIPLEQSGERFDYRVSMMSLPGLLGTELATIPASTPYLSVDAAAISRWSDRIDRRTFNVGLAWSGRSLQANNDDRSCTLDDLAPLGDIAGVSLYSLQKGAASQEASHPPPGMQLVDFTRELKDFADTAALMENLDLVISIDTSVAHLAGALGRPTWVLLWSNHCWRYALETSECPWYPGMRLFRQDERGQWGAVVRVVADNLRVLAREGGRANRAPN